MNVEVLVKALDLPTNCRVDRKVSKKLLLENGAPTATDKRYINDGIEEFLWLAALKPTTIGVPSYRDETREYLEIAILSLTLRPTALTARLTELIHRAIPYPVFLMLSQATGFTLSLAHLRWSQGQSGQTVLDGPLVVAQVEEGLRVSNNFLASLNVASQPRQNLNTVYQGWVECFEAYSAARLTGRFVPAADAATAKKRRIALAEHDQLIHEIGTLRSRAKSETQLNRRVDLNLKLKQLEARLSEVANQF